MSSKTVLITGANSGIGLETAVVMASAGARTVITARNAARGEQALDEIKARSNSDDVHLVLFDLGSLESVRRGAAEILDRFDRLDVLINNAGLVLGERQLSADGYEATFAINHLGPFLLTELLLDRLKESAPARIVNVSSTAHKSARKVNFDDLMFTKGYSSMRVYGHSKLLNILFTRELARRLEGTGVTVNCLHPGTVKTGFGQDGDASPLLKMGLAIGRLWFMSAPEGARTSIFLAQSLDMEGKTGGYYIKNKLKNPSKIARDPEVAAQLWEVSEKLIAEKS